MHKFRIPLKAVSVNQAYSLSRKRLILSKRGKKFKEDCTDFLKEQFTEEKPLKGKLRVRILFQFRSFREKIDVDNHFKLLQDSMTGIVFDDDSQIFKISGEKQIGMDRNEIHIFIDEID